MLLVTFLLVLHSVTIVQSKTNYSEKGWEAAKTFLSEFMDPTIDPCTDFSGFMCANFGNASDPNYYTWESEEQRKFHVRTMVEAIKGIDLNSTKTPKYARLVRNFYDQCMKADRSSKNLKVVYDVLSPILGPHPAFGNSNSTNTSDPREDIWYLLGKLQSEFGDPIVTKRPEIRIMSNDGKKRQGYLLLAPAGAYSRDYSANRTQARIRNLAPQLNIKVDEDQLKELISETSQLIEDWSSASGEGDSARADDGNFTSVPDLKPSYWRGLLASDLINQWLNVPKPGGTGQIIIVAELMNAVAQVFNNAPVRAVKTLLYEYYLSAVAAPTIGMSFGKQAIWINENFDRQTGCIEYVAQQATTAAARVLFDHIGEDLPTWRNEFILIAKHVYAAMRILLNSIDYMTPATKEAVNRKIDAIRLNPGIPTWIMDDDKVVADSIAYDDTQSFYANVMRRNGEIFKKELREKLLDPENAEADPRPTLVVNSNYNPWPNNIHINVFLGYNIPPYFSQFYPLAIKYGLTGFVISHELMHAFDPGSIEGTQLLTEEELEIYRKSASCVTKQYSSACYKEAGLCQVGSQAIRDNVADIGGLKVAFAAYQLHKAVVGEEPPLPGFANYTDDQLFFMAYRRFYCARNEPPPVWTIQNHSPSTTRAKVALRNTPHFAQAFQCAVGSKEAPTNPCKMWGDILGSAWN